MSNQLNARAHPSPKEFAEHAKAAASSCWVSQSAAGAPVTQVTQSTTTQNNLYWLVFSPDKTNKSVKFSVTFKSGSPLADQTQQFSFPGGYSDITTTPFGVPFWGGNPIIGPAVLTVQADGATAGTYNFQVVT
jgi:hypothetical protein